MSDEPVEKHLYDYLVEQIAALDEDDPLVGIDLHRHPYQKFDERNKWFGLRIGNCSSDLAPNPGASQIEEFDGTVWVIAFARIRKTDHSDLEDAVNKSFALGKWAAGLFFTADGCTLGQRVNDARVNDKCSRHFEEIGSALYAVFGLPMLINDTGQSR